MSYRVQTLNIKNDNVYRVVELIAGLSPRSQREVASSTGLSLGLVNIIIRRLIQTGHIRVNSLNQRKLQYILTPKGMMEKTRRAYSYVSNTIRTFSEYRWRIEKLVSELIDKNEYEYAVLGNGEVALLVEMVIKSLVPRAKVRRLKTGSTARPREVLLDCRPEGRDGSLGISVLSRLLNDEETRIK